MSQGQEQIAVLGSGSIGVAWAIVFARAGHEVVLYDPDAERVELGRAELDERLQALSSFGLLDEQPHVVATRVRSEPTLARAVAGADYVQECVPESLALKRALFAEVESVAAPDTIVASSSSALIPKLLFSERRDRRCCLVVHPGNPPYLLPVAEVVPGEDTGAQIVARTRDLLESAGVAVVIVRREVEGFVFNRLQGALLREAYCLVRDGVVDAAGIDLIVSHGLGRRWAVTGPFETVDLNTRGGIEAHAQRMGPAYARMGAERGQDDPWTESMVKAVSRERREALPLSAWGERVLWRDSMLMALERARRAATS